MTPMNVRFVQGDSKVLRVTVRFRDGSRLGLAGLNAARYRAARTIGSAAVVDKGLGQGISIYQEGTDDEAVDVVFAPGDTQAHSGEYRHELELVDEDGAVMTAFQGWLTLDPALIA